MNAEAKPPRDIADRATDFQRCVEIAQTPIGSLVAPLSKDLAMLCWSVSALLSDRDKSALPLAGWVSVWVTRWGLTVAECSGVLELAMAPGFLPSCKFPGDATARLHQAASDLHNRKKCLRKMAERRGLVEAEKADAKTLIGGIGRRV